MAETLSDLPGQGQFSARRPSAAADERAHDSAKRLN